ncbi:hypothetical protein GF386_03525 [Candidatus Pacearchaeota archaeon]|nr:hypothetical protein [Candidatus Pacearchaeota archaeon]MBD3283221.1 hypothetical protein [Candidatus Pacearchaeota archaeon]
MKFSFKFRKRKFQMNVKVCKDVLSKTSGLMFKKNSPCLLFVFRKKGPAIHSFFCKPFIAIWFNDNEIVHVRLIEGWKFSIKPKKEFNKLLEIPASDENFEKLKKVIL